MSRRPLNVLLRRMNPRPPHMQINGGQMWLYQEPNPQRWLTGLIPACPLERPSYLALFQRLLQPLPPLRLLPRLLPLPVPSLQSLPP